LELYRAPCDTGESRKIDINIVRVQRFVVGKTDRALQAWRHLADKVHLNQSRYVELVCGDSYSVLRTAAQIVDAHEPRISEFAGDVYAHSLISSVHVPAGMIDRLQPNDVGVYGPLTQIVKRLLLEQKRDEPDEWDSMSKAVERYLAAWTELDRNTVRKAWVKAVPLLSALPDEVRHVSV
jgi:hypothetical protein